MTETLVQWFVTHLGGKAAKELIIFIISMIPILELRGGILAAGPAFLNIPTWRAIPICLVGNLIPIPFILLLIRPIFAWLRKTRLFRPLVEKLEKKAMSKSDRISRYEFMVRYSARARGSSFQSLLLYSSHVFPRAPLSMARESIFLE